MDHGALSSIVAGKDASFEAIRILTMVSASANWARRMSTLAVLDETARKSRATLLEMPNA